MLKLCVTDGMLLSMRNLISRRRWIQAATSSLAVLSAGAIVLAESSPSPASQPAKASGKKDKGPPIAPQLVREFVGAGHANLDRVREMLAQYPTIVNGTWDWGGGDFESALGGASHMGRPDIAEFLLVHGARLDLFAAAMLGRLEIIRATCAAFPAAPQIPGPHGITLIEHARKGGAPAKAVLDYLESLG